MRSAFLPFPQFISLHDMTMIYNSKRPINHHRVSHLIVVGEKKLLCTNVPQDHTPNFFFCPEKIQKIITVDFGGDNKC
jgi:hypothetical protein